MLGLVDNCYRFEFWTFYILKFSYISALYNMIFLQAAFIGAMAIADLVKTKLGPKGMVCF
jgi:hypothetical protein